MFCYTDDYDDSSSGANQADHQSLISAISQIQLEAPSASFIAIEEQGQFEEVQDTAISSNDSLGENDTQQNTIDDPIWEGLMNNALMYAIADKYFIHQLKALAMEKFKALTEKSYRTTSSTLFMRSLTRHQLRTERPSRSRGKQVHVAPRCTFARGSFREVIA